LFLFSFFTFETTNKNLYFILAKKRIKMAVLCCMVLWSVYFNSYKNAFKYDTALKSFFTSLKWPPLQIMRKKLMRTKSFFFF
jgi:hypothetical protein